MAQGIYVARSPILRAAGNSDRGDAALACELKKVDQTQTCDLKRSLRGQQSIGMKFGVQQHRIDDPGQVGAPDRLRRGIARKEPIKKRIDFGVEMGWRQRWHPEMMGAIASQIGGNL